MKLIVAAVLCGGRGTRLQPVIGSLPKCLAPVGGRPFLSYVLDQIAGQGVMKTVLCVRVGATAVLKAFPQEHEGMELDYSWEPSPLGTGGALKNALPLLDSDPVLVLNGDTYCRFDLDALLMSHQQSDVAVTMICSNWAPMKPSGVYLLSQRFLNTFPEGPSSLEELVAAQPSNRVWRYFTASEFLDIGTPETYGGDEAWMAARGML